ncbi:MAG: hypothetical protein FWF67_00745 [Fibromonadales bacterium]|nr:hypothetical protein [Fibromonadales bacterium]
MVKKILPIAMCAALLFSCASKRAGVVDSAITEAKTLQALSKAVGVEDPAAAELIANAEKQNEARQTEQAYVLADKAVLQYQLSMLKRENDVLTEDKNNAEKELAIYREALYKQKAPKQVN